MQKSAGRRPATRWDLLGVAFCLQWLAGCGSLPMLVPDLAQPSIRTVSMQDARGPLMAEQTRALLAGLERRSPDTGIFDEHLAREQAINRGPLTTGNSVRLLQDGPATCFDHVVLDTRGRGTTSIWKPTSSTMTK